MKRLLPLIVTFSIIQTLPVLADCNLRQSDAVEIALGPYVDSTDGVTAETALTISQGDVILKKCAAAGDCAASAQKNDAGACTHDANGVYECDLNATDTDTVGILEIWSFEAGAAPVFRSCEVVETAIYDSLYADAIGGIATAAALNTVDDFVDTEVADILTDTGTSGVVLAAGSVNTTSVATGAIGDDELNVTGSEFTAIPDIDTLLEALVVLGAEQTADSGTTTTVVDAALTQATDDWFKGMGLHFTSGTLAGQDACVTAFSAAGDALTFAPAVTTAVTTHTYYLLPNSECFSGASGSGATAQEVWEYATRGLTVLDEDTTTLDLNNTTIGTLASFDEDATAIDINNTALGTVGSVTGTVGAIATAGILPSSFDTSSAGANPALGVIDAGTAQSATSTTLVLRAATPFSSDDAIKGTTLWALGSDQGYWQSELVTGYVTATDTASVNTWDVTPTGTITYRLWGTPESAAGAGGGATAQEVWEYATRTLTALDEDVTTLDLNATTVGTLTTLDEDTTTLDLNATTIGVVTTATNVTTLNGIANNVITALSIATGALDADAAAADLSTELWSAAARTLTSLDEDATTLDLDATTIGNVTNVGGSSLRTGLGMASANLDTQLAGIESGVDVDTFEGVDATDALDARLLAFLATQGILVGTCDTGSTTTCVDDALTQAATSQIDDHMICFPTDTFCAMATDFTPGTDTVTITKTAPSTRASKTYILWPSTLQ